MDKSAIIEKTLALGDTMNNCNKTIAKSNFTVVRLRIYSSITFLNSFSSGILTPVLSLLLIEKGLTLSNLSMVLGIYALTAVVLELPTGIAADVIGRKNVFCLSLAVSVVCFTIIFMCQGVIALVVGMIFYGINKALASGSFDALFIDWYLDTFGKENLPKITYRMSVLDTLGFSLGAITGGLLPLISKSLFPNSGIYGLNLWTKIFSTLVLIVISYAFIRETDSFKESSRKSVRQHILDSYSAVKSNRTLLFIFMSVLSTGFFLSALETYWQPHFKSLLSDNMIWLLGIIAFLYMGSGMLGNILSGKIIDKFKIGYKEMYLVLRVILALSLAILSMQTKIPLFLIAYSGTYLFFGMSYIPEGIIINGEIQNNMRASILSVYSFIFQFGALLGSFINSIIINYVTIPSLWMIAAGIILVTAITVYKKLIYDVSKAEFSEGTINK